MNKKMICINQQTGVFCDSYVGNDTGILFASFWGRNTSLQQFLARMELPPHEGGINELTFLQGLYKWLRCSVSAAVLIFLN
jgi:hypothetical protein